MRSTHATPTYRFLPAVAAFGLALSATACDPDDGNGTGPGEQGTVQAVVTDDPGAAGASVTGIRGSLASGSADVTGAFSGDAKVEVSADGQTWIELGQMQSVDVALQAADEATIHASASVPARTFTRVRLVVRNAEATVLAGSTIDAGPIGADITLQVAGGGEFTVEKAVTLDVSADSETTLVFDLNSESWIDENAVQAGAVAASEVQSATSVRVE